MLILSLGFGTTMAPPNKLLDPNTSLPTPPQVTSVRVVGIGASAGGLEALERLFNCMPCDSRLAFVVVQHLSPDFKSLMSELLSRWTKMRITVVEDGMRVEPDRIYLMPPKKLMILSGGQLWLKDKFPEGELFMPIDQFFRSLRPGSRFRCHWDHPFRNGV